jgi:hypothetical protein
MCIKHINQKKAVFMENEFEVETGPVFTQLNQLTTMGSVVNMMPGMTAFLLALTTGK